MGLGLLCFGFATGGIAGLSLYSGISQTLLTSVFTFAGGALLTFGGFVRAQRKASGVMFLRVSRVGAGLCCFSLGLVGGVLGGISLRVRMAEATAQASPHFPPTPGATAFALQTNVQEVCATILSKTDDAYEGEQGAKAARHDLRWLREHARCGP
jgi:hypothetical protein